MRGTPDMLFDANLYAVMGKLEGKKKEKPDGKKSPSSPASSKPVSPPARINSSDTRVPSVPGLIGRGPRSLPPPPVRRTILFPLLL